jgi:hypothetical protein
MNIIYKQKTKVIILVLPWTLIFGIKGYHKKQMFKLECEEKYALINNLVHQDCEKMPFWEFYNKKIAFSVGNRIEELEQNQKYLVADRELEKHFSLRRLQRRHYHLVLMAVPTLRADCETREKIINAFMPEESHVAEYSYIEGIEKRWRIATHVDY